MDSAIQLISDGDGLAILGEPGAVEQFLIRAKLEATPGRRLRPMDIATVAGAIQAVSEAAANFGSWRKLTPESVEKIKRFNLMKNSTTGLDMGVVQGPGGRIQGNVQFMPAGQTNPALLTGVAGIMAQYAMQQAMDEISEYLQIIDEKVDDILRAQKDAALADMIAVGFVIDEAMTVREHVGRVSEVTWSKVQNSSMAIARTQGYALRQLDALAEKLESKTDVNELRRTAKDAESTVRDWLAVLARCFQLQEALSILELDRVLDAAAEELDLHRAGLRAARDNRRDLVTRSTDHLMARLDDAADLASVKVLLHPIDSRAIVHSSNRVATDVLDFQGRLGIEGDREALDPKRWVDAAGDVRDDVLDVGTKGVKAARLLGSQAADRGRSVTNKLAREIAERTRDRGGDDVD